MNDIRLTEININEFNEEGWTVVNLGFTSAEITRYQKTLLKLREQTLNIKFAPRRVYYDHLTRFNMAAIELPFNSIFINQNIEELFSKARLGSLICSLMKWDQTKCKLARLFTMDHYNYRGSWHRDYENIDSIQDQSNKHNFVLAALYLFDQSGFRIMKKEYDLGGAKSVVNNKEMDLLIRSHNMPIAPPKDSYNVLKAPAGSVIIFNPLLLHQGSNYGSRLDYHLGFTKETALYPYKNSFQDFSVSEHYLQEYDFSNQTDTPENLIQTLKNIPFSSRDTIYSRIRNSINYKLPILNVFRQYKNYRLSFSSLNLNNFKWKPEFLANSMWQRD